jgi:hypothetical protein
MEQSNRDIRNRSHVRVVYNQIDTTAASDGEYSDSGHTLYSSHDTVDIGYLTDTTYATLEHNRFLLDGTQELLPEDSFHDEGFIGDAISDENGIYALPRPTLTKEFEQKHSIVGMTITFDSVLSEYPKRIAVRFYNNGVQVFYVDINNISSSVIAFERKIQVFDKYSIEFIESGKPYRRARVQSVAYGLERVFSNAQIESTKQTTDIDPISRRLPTEKFTFTLFDYEQKYNPENPVGQWEYVDTQSPVSVQYGYELDDGTIEWLAPDRYLLDGRPTVQNNRVSFSATKLVEYLSGTFYRGAAGSKTLYEMAEDVLLDADLPLTDSLENPWYIDPALQEIETTGILPIDSHRNCLQLIAHAGMCRLYTDSNGIIRMERTTMPDQTEDFTLNLASAWSKPIVSKTEPLYSINVLKYTNSAATASIQLHSSTFDVNGSVSFYAEFSAAEDVSVDIVGGTLSDVAVYACATTATITASGSVTVTITGHQIETTTSGVPYVVTSDTRGEEEVIENPLVTTDAHKAALEKHIADYLAFRATYTLDYRGNPEIEAGDLIRLQSQFTASFPALVLKHEITLNTSLSGSGIFKGIWFKRFAPYYAGEIYAGETVGVI